MSGAISTYMLFSLVGHTTLLLALAGVAPSFALAPNTPSRLLALGLVPVGLLLVWAVMALARASTAMRHRRSGARALARRALAGTSPLVAMVTGYALKLLIDFDNAGYQTPVDSTALQTLETSLIYAGVLVLAGVVMVGFAHLSALTLVLVVSVSDFEDSR